MNRLILACVALSLSSAALGAQQADRQNPYQGTSAPPPDDTIVTGAPPQAAPQAKPPAGHPMNAPAAAPVPGQAEPQPSSVDPSVNNPSGTDGGMVQGTVPAPAPTPAPTQPALTPRGSAPDPDGDMVHPEVQQPGQLGEGTTIRVKLLDRLSTMDSEKGESFRSQVSADVLQGGQVLIPAGTEIDGKVVQVSSGGRLGGHGSMRLRPETVILADGSRYLLHAEITGAPGSKTRIGDEGVIKPGSRTKRDSIEYGGVVGAGAVTGLILGGPAGAVTGGLIGAGVVTTHILVSHPQATLEPGTTLLFTLTEPLQMTPATPSGN